jgi:hypothetical protein
VRARGEYERREDERRGEIKREDRGRVEMKTGGARKTRVKRAGGSVKLKGERQKRKLSVDAKDREGSSAD